MKKYIYCLLCLLLVIAISGCKTHTSKDFTHQSEGSSVIVDDDDDEDEEEEEDEQEETVAPATKEEETSASTEEKKEEKKEETSADDFSPATPKKAGTKVIVIDPGHQAKANLGTEPIGPGAKEKKTKVTGGATGKKTKVKESEIVLSVGKKLKKKLEAKGYKVIMTRTTQKVDLSNKQRADIANDAKADVFIRLHCDGASSADVHGASVLGPKSDNPYMTKANIKASQSLCSTIIKAFCDTTGAKNRGVSKVNNMSGINWCKVPVCIIEMGFLSNADEEALLVDDSYQDKCADGITNGIVNYLNS